MWSKPTAKITKEIMKIKLQINEIEKSHGTKLSKENSLLTQIEVTRFIQLMDIRKHFKI